MKRLIWVFASLILSAVTVTATSVSLHAQDAPFAHRQSERDGARYEAYLTENWKPGKQSAEALLKKARAVSAEDPRQKARLYALAAVADKSNAPAWIGLARALLKIDPATSKGSERYDLPVNAGGAAYIAYTRSTNDTHKATALFVLSQSLQRRSLWRPALESLKASLALEENAFVRAVYTKVRAEHGFRMTDYTTQAESASPRVCLQFSETLSRAPVDFSKFVSVDGKDPQNIAAEGSQLCLEGFTHGARYEIQIRQGLPSAVNENLERSATLAVYVPDRKPFARFSGRAYVLPSRGQQGIPVITVNTDKVNLEIYRIGDRALVNTLNEGELGRQLSSWNINNLKQRSGQEIYKGTMDVATRLNEEVTTAFPVSDAIGTMKPGVYIAVARPDGPKRNYENSVATQWFIVSDLGLTAFSGSDGVHAFVRSLAGADAITGAKIKLIARNNEVLATGETDARGYVHFEGAITRGEGGTRPAVLVAQNGPTDYAFLDLTAGAFDLSDRGVKGRPSPGAIDAMVYTERGVYRPGEEVHVASLVRETTGQASALPVTLIITRPDGVEHRRVTMTDEGLGGRTMSMLLADGAMTGTWRARVHVDPQDPAIAETAFLVEDFVPERLDMTLTAQDKTMRPGTPSTLTVAGRFLYGPPAADLALEGEVIVKAGRTGPKGYEDYTFGLSGEVISPVRRVLENLPNTGSDGAATVALDLPKIPKTARPLEATVLVRLNEPGGRTIERRTRLPVNLGMTRIGLKPKFDARGLESGETANFEVVVLGPDNKPADTTGVIWTLKQRHTNWQWYSRDGYWNYEPVTISRKVETGTLDVAANAPATISVPLDYGRYVLEVASASDPSVETTYAFTAGWFVSGDDPESPEMLDVALDKKAYQPGDSATLRISSKNAGRALVTVLANGLKDIHEIEVPRGGANVEIPVSKDWGAGAYITATLYRPMDETAKRMPGRAVGIAWLKLDQSQRTLGVEISTPEKIGSGEPVNVPLKITGLNAGEEAYVTVAAVDVGIVNLTRYKAPNPEGRFYAQTRLATEMRDAYGRLIDGMRAERGRLRSGGDAGGGMNMQGSPPVEETVAEFSGVVRVGPDGAANVSFDIPQFNGSVRIMAVAWSQTKLGHKSQDLIVRDPVALTATLPRFLTLGDKADASFDLHNVDGDNGDYSFALAQQPELGLESSLVDTQVALEKGKRTTQTVTLAPAKVGRINYTLRVTGPGGIDVSRAYTIDVVPPAGDIKRRVVSQVSEGGSLEISHDLIHDLIPERTFVNVSVGPTARLDVPSVLTQLDRYPYGCAEQTVSRALPLVYANDLAVKVGLATDKELKKRVQGAVDHVLQMQDSSGAFGAWGPSNTNIWLTAYVTDFLTRAKEAGYEVDPLKLSLSLDRLQNFIAYASDFEKGGERRAYALYVLARNGKAPVGELRYYIDTRLSRFSTPLAQAQLGAAMAMTGDKVRAKQAFDAAIKAMTKTPEAPAANLHVARYDYGSRLRDGAALVALTSEAGLSTDSHAGLVDVVAKAYSQRHRYTSTQEQAWMLLAAHALSKQAEQTRLTINGEAHSGPFNDRIAGIDLSDTALNVKNDAGEPVDAVLSVVGAALTPEPASANGFDLTRAYYTMDGKPVELGSATGGTGTLKQNDRLVVVLSMTTKHEGGRILLVDRLPAGLEIENPRLVAGGDIKALSWLKTDIRPEHTEFRDDRFAAAFDLMNARERKAKPAGSTTTVAYVVRAVTPGSFVHPAATVEDMYRPDRNARTATGRLTITGANQ